jgi:hypothetical protein
MKYGCGAFRVVRSRLTAVVQEFSGKNLWEVFFLAVSFDTSSAETPVRRSAAAVAAPAAATDPPSMPVR